MARFTFKLSNVDVSFLTLSFPKELEAEFRADYNQKAITHVRVATLLIVFFMCLFGILDAWLVPLEKENLWLIRYALFLPFSLVFFISTFSKYFTPFMQPLNAALIVVAGLGIVGMILVVPAAKIYSYYAGLILVLLFGYTFFKLRFLWATVAGWMIVIAYEIAAIFLTQTPLVIVINNNFFFLTGNILGMCACYTIELYIRKDFLLVRELTIERKKVSNANVELKVSLDTVKSTQRQLVEREKMAALGSLVAGVAHEINTPVGVAITAASLLEEKTRFINDQFTSGNIKRSDLESYIETASDSTSYVLSNIMRAADLIRSFKQVAVDQTSEEQRQFKVKAYIENVLLSLNPKLKRTRHQIEVNCADELEIESYPGAFSQVVTNLVMNSLIHGFEGIKKGKAVFDVSADVDEITLRYHDNGIGMDETKVKYIYDPFFTTKFGQGGSGLGMHIVYNVITQTLDGHIECESKPGEGTAFIIKIPRKIEVQND